MLHHSAQSLCLGLGLIAGGMVMAAGPPKALAPWQRPLTALPIAARIKVPAGPAWLETGFGSVWVTKIEGKRVLRIDPGSNAVVATIPVHAEPRFLAAGDGAIWVVSQGDGTLARIDPETNRVTATIAVSAPGPGGDIAVGAGNVWVSAEGAPLSQVDPRSNRLVRQYVGGTRQDTLRVAFGAAWVVDELGGEIWRIDLRRVVQ